MVSTAFLSAVVASAAALGMTPDALLRVWYFESAGLNPAAVSPDHAHFGLNQLAGSWLTAHGIDPSDYITWSAERQLPVVLTDVKERMKSLNHGQPFPDEVRYYIANLLPVAYAGATSDDAIIMKEGDPWYAANAGLDIGKKGYVNVLDIRNRMNMVAHMPGYKAVMARLGKLQTAGGSVSAGAVLLFGLSVGLGALAGRRKG